MSNALYFAIQKGCSDDELRGKTPLVPGSGCADLGSRYCTKIFISVGPAYRI